MTTHPLAKEVGPKAVDPTAVDRVGAPGGPDRPASAGRPIVSLYTRVIVVNAAIVLAAVVALIVTPVTVSSPVALEQALVLAAGVVVMVLADAVLLRLSFGGLTSLAQRMEEVDLLRPEQRLPERGPSEVRSLIAGFNAMLDRLENERQETARRTVAALEDERRRIGLELHDEIGQRLTGILLQLGRLHEDAPPELRQRIHAVQEQGRAAMDEVGALAWQLRPSVLDDLGLVSALESLVGSYEEDDGIDVRADLPADPLPPLSHDAELALYRVAQEAVTNAVRHAEASSVRLALAEHPGGVVLQVTDDGCGLPAGVEEGPGIRGMRERALLVGARLGIDSRRGSGVRVRIDLPADGARDSR